MQMHPEELWTSPELKAKFLRTALTPASWLYAAGWQAYLAIYTLGLKRAVSPHSPVVCVGNLLVGGTGKTPTTIHLADVLSSLGRQVVISCSGYGSPASEAARLAPSGPLEAGKWGDEAALIRWLRPDIPLVVGRRRVLAASICHESYPDSVLVLDDGFQHLPLRKTVTLVLDPPQPNMRCLPAGPYREPPSNRRRADLVLPGQFRIELCPASFQDSRGDVREVSGEVDVLCALGRPQTFLDALRAQGLIIRASETRPDHDSLAEGNLLQRFESGRPILVTGKDWVKLRERADADKYDIVIAGYEIRIEPHAEFRSWLQAKLNQDAEKKD
jgi:tetraacyldisaccharide 4'-kinase